MHNYIGSIYECTVPVSNVFIFRKLENIADEKSPLVVKSSAAVT